MDRRTVKLMTAVVSGLVLVGGSAAAGTGGAAPRTAGHEEGVTHTRLGGYQEVPAVSTDGRGRFRAALAMSGESARYRLAYSGLSSPVQQAHVHFGQRSVNGGISVFLCTNLGNGPVGTPTCPAAGGVVTGTITAEDVIGPTTQGIAPGELEEIVAAVVAGVAYVNVHTDTFPGGEIRGQLH